MKMPEDRVGILLEPFSPGNADLVLSWRNAEHVRVNSLDDRIIRKEEHLNFVQGLKSRPDVGFFVVFIDGMAQAVMNIDVSRDEAMWGCYLGGENPFRPGLFPMLILLSGYLAFFRYSRAVLWSDVLSRNAAPQTMNAFLGIDLAARRYEMRSSGTSIEVLSYRFERAGWPTILDRAGKVLTRYQLALVERFFMQASMRA